MKHRYFDRLKQAELATPVAADDGGVARRSTCNRVWGGNVSPSAVLWVPSFVGKAVPVIMVITVSLGNYNPRAGGAVTLRFLNR